MTEQVVGSLIAAGSGLLGTIIGGCITFLVQHKITADQERTLQRSLASAVAAEIDAYLALMDRRNHVAAAKQLSASLRSGKVQHIRGFMNKDAKPLEDFPLFQQQLGKIGVLGDLCFDLARFYTLLAGVHRTVIDAENGKYDNARQVAKADLVDSELALWEEALALARQLLPRLKRLAGLSK
jgi:hypothetical protein